MKRRILSSLIVLSTTMSTSLPVFAAGQTVQGKAPQSGTVPVTGTIEKYTPESTGA